MNDRTEPLPAHPATLVATPSANPFDSFLVTTMDMNIFPPTPSDTWVTAGTNYVTVRIDVIEKYESIILELRRKLLHYRDLFSGDLAGRVEDEEYAGPDSVIPMDAASIRVLNSVMAARIPPTAIFTDFEDGEL